MCKIAKNMLREIKKKHKCMYIYQTNKINWCECAVVI